MTLITVKENLENWSSSLSFLSQGIYCKFVINILITELNFISKSFHWERSCLLFPCLYMWHLIWTSWSLCRPWFLSLPTLVSLLVSLLQHKQPTKQLKGRTPLRGGGSTRWTRWTLSGNRERKTASNLLSPFLSVQTPACENHHLFSE